MIKLMIRRNQFLQMTTMSDQTNDVAKKTRRLAVITSLRQGKFSDMKNSSILIDVIKKQKDEVFANKCAQVVLKQQRIVHRLNEENMRLVNENDALKREICETRHSLNIFDKKNQEYSNLIQNSSSK